MDPVEAVWLLVALEHVDHVPGAADASHDHVVLHWRLCLGHAALEGPLKGSAYTEVATAWAPLEIVLRVL